MKIISLGVGIQSTALYYQSSLGELERCDHAIFADTGGEKTRTLKYWNYLLNWQGENNGIPLYKANYLNLKNDLLNNVNSSRNRFASIPAFTLSNGNVGMLMRQCTGEYKIGQVNKKIKEILCLSKNARYPTIEVWQGITLDEAERMRVPYNKWQINVYPFCGYKVYFDGRCEKIDTKIQSRNDVLNWYKEKGLPVPEKSSCIFCPFQADYNWIRLKQTEPQDFAEAVKVDNAIRNSSKKGIKKPYILARFIVTT